MAKLVKPKVFAAIGVDECIQLACHLLLAGPGKCHAVKVAMNVTILAYIEREGSKKVDAVMHQVADALQSKGHETNILAASSDLSRLVEKLTKPRPDLVFNLMEMFGDNVLAEVGVAGLLELVGAPFTGCGPGEFYLQQDKALAKKLLAFDEIKYPDYAVFSPDSLMETGGKLRLPLFVKPLRADASIGIDGKSLVRTSTDLMKRVVHIHEELHDSALAEEFIEGREFYIGVLGNNDPIAFPPIEMDFSKMDPDLPHIADSKAKWDKKSAEYKGTQSVLADVPDELCARLQKAAIAAYRALRVRDYGRVDFRVSDTGDIYVIEVNASCYLEKQSEFAMAAKAAGIEYTELINRIAELALERHSQRLSRVSIK
jgi:D-alanine-D-alanine ligase